MITLEKILTELKAESLNEIVAGKPGKGQRKGGGASATGTSADTQASVTTLGTMSMSES